MAKYIDYLFEDNETGENFFVEIKQEEKMTVMDCFVQALKTANEYFESPKFIEEVEPHIAEIMGFDIY